MNYSMDDELRVNRQRLAALEELIARLESADLAGAAARVVKTVSQGSYPTGSGSMKFFAVRGQDVRGTTSEGQSGVLSEDAREFHALNLGTGLPPVGTELVATYVPNRWVFRYDA